MATTFIIARIARKNPEINGLTLYMTGIGHWSLERHAARRFDSREAANEWVGPLSLGAWVEEAA